PQVVSSGQGDPGGSHCSPASTSPLPQTGAVQVQSSLQAVPSAQLEPGGSHCSPGSMSPLPQTGSVQVQSRPQMVSSMQADPGGSHSSPGSTVPSPQAAVTSHGKMAEPVCFSKLARKCSHEGRGWTSQSCASQYALHR